ncbi:hypothetical protein FNF31_04598 [Cafeteria roenbergensis]|uniref:Uncharacterized protein n=1 Tax=Cafeteria roenbergensis TaxID=33653 RepID=A0A5A8D3D2_CAFRO|nr:hypothetical protein FNF31_04598 [Cafeteria roenbergensis]
MALYGRPWLAVERIPLELPEGVSATCAAAWSGGVVVGTERGTVYFLGRDGRRIMGVVPPPPGARRSRVDKVAAGAAGALLAVAARGWTCLRSVQWASGAQPAVQGSQVLALHAAHGAAEVTSLQWLPSSLGSWGPSPSHAAAWEASGRGKFPVALLTADDAGAVVRCAVGRLSAAGLVVGSAPVVDVVARLDAGISQLCLTAESFLYSDALNVGSACEGVAEEHALPLRVHASSMPGIRRAAGAASKAASDAASGAASERASEDALRSTTDHLKALPTMQAKLLR